MTSKKKKEILSMNLSLFDMYSQILQFTSGLSYSFDISLPIVLYHVILDLMFFFSFDICSVYVCFQRTCVRERGGVKEGERC